MVEKHRTAYPHNLCQSRPVVADKEYHCGFIFYPISIWVIFLGRVNAYLEEALTQANFPPGHGIPVLVCGATLRLVYGL